MKAMEGIRVLDMTHVLAGPFSTYQLAVLGADVIKIEGPGAVDMNREIGAVAAFNHVMMGSHFQSQAANKRAVTLNLKTEKGRAVFKELAKTADVIVENFRSGKLASLGLGYEDIAAIKPDIIYCSLTGFGQTGPKREHAAFDNTIQAYAGMIPQTGATDGDPVLIGPPLLDYGTGAQAAFAIASALLRRERTGKGQHIDIAMLDAALLMMSSGVLNTNTLGQPPGRSLYGRRPYAGYGGYETADGLLMIGAVTPSQYEKLWRALGRDDLADEARTKRIPDFTQCAERDEAVLVDLFKTKTADEWEAILVAAGLPAARARTLDETLADAQVTGRGVVGEFPSRHSKHGRLKPAVAAFQCSEDGPSIEREPPELGGHTREVLSEIGFGPDEIDAMAEAGVI
jgi:crotonobetainyl-CoA:carnitine CoA-transferase CaiB-like acyl-CoA transferase